MDSEMERDEIINATEEERGRNSAGHEDDRSHFHEGEDGRRGRHGAEEWEHEERSSHQRGHGTENEQGPREESWDESGPHGRRGHHGQYDGRGSHDEHGPHKERGLHNGHGPHDGRSPYDGYGPHDGRGPHDDHRRQEGRGPHGAPETREGHGPHDGHGPHYEHGQYDRRGSQDEHGPHGDHEPDPYDRCGHRPHHGHPTNWEEESLADLMRRCGHTLHHGRGEARSQERILRILSDHEELSQGELMEILRIRPGSMSEIITKLESRGYLVRERDERDRRRAVLRITDAGRERIQTQSREEEENLFAALTPQERETLRTLVIRLLRSWEDGPDIETGEGFPADQGGVRTGGTDSALPEEPSADQDSRLG